METAPPQFLDVPALLERSQPAPRHGWFWYAVGIFLLLVVTSAYFSRQSVEMDQAIGAVSTVAMIGLMIAMAGVTLFMAARQRQEMRQIEAIEELVQLRR